MGSEKTACLIIIGNEILSGRTQDANLAYLGRRCDELGLPLVEARVIPDVSATIVATVNACRAAHDYVFTTGGIGPTHDDITAAAVAGAFGVAVERNPAAVAAMQAYYADAGQLTGARLKMADIPRGARLIDNPVSGAPGFQLDNVFVLPGVPMIMQAMFEGMTDRLAGGPPILSDSVHTNLREGTIAEGLGRIQAANPDTRIGSYPYFRQGKAGVNLVIRDTEQGRIDKVKYEILALIKELHGRIM